MLGIHLMQMRSRIFTKQIPNQDSVPKCMHHWCQEIELEYYVQIMQNTNWFIQCTHLANTRAASSYYMAFYSQSGKIRVYKLSFQTLFDNIYQEKYVS